MATAYSSEVSVGTYNRIRMRVEYSGTSATCYMEFRRTSSYTGEWGDMLAQITLNGVTKSAPYWYSGTVGTSWVQLCNASGFTIPTSGGTFNWTFNNPQSASVLGCSGTITLSSQGTPPSNGKITNLTAYWDIGDDVPVIQAGTISVNDGGLTVPYFYMFADTEPYVAGDSARNAFRAPSNSISVNNARINAINSYWTGGSSSVWMLGNQRIYTALKAENSAGNYYYTTADGAPSVVTPPPPPNFVVGTATSTSQSFTVSLPATGGVYSQDIQYRLNGGSWTTIHTVTGTAAVSVTKTISGLTPGTFYTMETRATSTAGTTSGNTVRFATTSTDNFYGSVSSQATHINKLYGHIGMTNWFNKSQSGFKSDNATISVSDDIITVTGSSTAGTYRWAGIPVKNIDYLLGQTVTLSWDMLTMGTHTADIRLFWCNTSDSWYTDGISGTDAFKTTNSNWERCKKTFTIPAPKPSNAGNLVLMFYSNISSAASAVTKFTNVQLEVGDTETNYIPFLGTPASDNWYDQRVDNDTTQSSVTVAGFGGYYQLNGTASAADARIWFGRATLPAGTYTLRHEYISGTGANYATYFYQNNRSWTRPETSNFTVNSSTPIFTRTFTLSSATDVCLAIYTYSGCTFSNFKGRVSIVTGSTAMPVFKPYSGHPGATPIRKIYGSVNGVAKPFFIRHVHE